MEKDIQILSVVLIKKLYQKIEFYLILLFKNHYKTFFFKFDLCGSFPRNNWTPRREDENRSFLRAEEFPF